MTLVVDPSVVTTPVIDLSNLSDLFFWVQKRESRYFAPPLYLLLVDN